MQFQISPVAKIPSAIPLLADWHHQEWQHLNSQNYNLKARITDYEQIAATKVFPAMLVAHKNQTPLGSIRLIENDMDTHPELSPWIASLYVSEEYRRLGIGTALIANIETTAIELNFKKIYLFTENHQAIYKRQRWEIFSNEMYFNQNVTIMHKQLHE